MNDILKKKLMETTLSFAELSKCAAKKVCCLLYKDNNIISIGLNGTKSGSINCNEKFRKVDGEWYIINDKYLEKCNTHTKFEPHPDNSKILIKCDNKESHHQWSNLNEIHSEINAISKAKTSVENSVAFISHSPCFNCAKTLMAFGIKEIYYFNDYDDVEDVKEMLESNNIKIEKMNF